MLLIFELGFIIHESVDGATTVVEVIFEIVLLAKILNDFFLISEFHLN